MAQQKAPKIGQFVTYTDTKGHSKPALVTATPESLTEGTNLPELSDTQLHLVVFSPSGNIYPRQNVPFVDSVSDNSDFSLEVTDSDAQPTGEVKTIGVWSFTE